MTAARMSRKRQEVRSVLFMLARSIQIEADNQARILRLQKDPARATQICQSILRDIGTKMRDAN
jgi:hypothetical protein